MDDIVDRLRGRYAMGPHQPNGLPEFGWRQFQATPINLEAADEIARLRGALKHMVNLFEDGPPNVSDDDCEQAVDAARAVLFGELMNTAHMSGVGQSLMNMSAAVFRHTRGDDPEFCGMATYLGDGIFALSIEQIMKRDVREPMFCDIRFHMLGGDKPMVWSVWGMLTPMRPLVLMKAFEFTAPRPDIATIAETTVDEGVARIGFCHGVFHEAQPDSDPIVNEGYRVFGPFWGDYRSIKDGEQRAPSAMVCHANFNYPGPKDAGAPVVTKDGRLAGILLGGDLGPQHSHQGAYVPIEFIMPFVEQMKLFCTEKGPQVRIPYTEDVVYHWETPDNW